MNASTQPHAKKAQTSLEYLIILGIVLVIALIAVGLSIFFGQTQTDAYYQEIRQYWSVQAAPLKIVEMQGYVYSGNNGEVALAIENSDTKPINITNFLVDGEGASAFQVCDAHSTDGTATGTCLAAGQGQSNLNVRVAPGGQARLYLMLNSACKYDAANPPTSFSQNLTITYKTRYFSGISFKGLKPVAGKCNPS